MDSIRDRQARLHRLSHLLYRHPHGLTAREMADIVDVTPRTIQRDLKALEEAGIPLWDDGAEIPRYGIVSGYFLPPLQLTLNDASALYLAARLLTRNTDEHNPHVTSALAQLASVLPETMAASLQSAIQQLADRPASTEYRALFETLTLAWATGRKVQIRYRSARRTEGSDYVLHPYFIEPTGLGNTYVIGLIEQKDGPGELRTFKLDRIRSAKLLTETFETPEGMYPGSLLKESWGVVFGDPVQEVVLRFGPDVARRVDETVWHPSQKVEKLPNGGRLMRLRISGIMEIEPWIRTWGSQCEVIAPAALRQKLAEEAHSLAVLYADG